MKKGFVLLMVLVLLDQLTKTYFSKIDFQSDWLSIHVILNSGIIGGLYSDASSLFRVVFLSTLGIYLFGIYLWISYFLKKLQLSTLHFFLSGYTAGISGNLLDRIMRGGAIDFLQLHVPFVEGYIFNLADLFQLFFFILLIKELYHVRNILWYPQDQRFQFFINKKFQLKFMFLCNLALLIFFLSVFVFSYTFFMNTSSFIFSVDTKDSFLWGLVLLWLSFTVGFNFFLIYISQKISGPIYALKKWMLAKEASPFSLRTGDYHTEEIHELAELYMKDKSGND